MAKLFQRCLYEKFTLIYTVKESSRMIRHQVFYHMLNKNKYMGSGKFSILLDDSTDFQNLLKASIGMEKKILENSRLFWKVLDD